MLPLYCRLFCAAPIGHVKKLSPLVYSAPKTPFLHKNIDVRMCELRADSLNFDVASPLNVVIFLYSYIDFFAHFELLLTFVIAIPYVVCYTR
jgi:hypothetical protein